MTSTSKKNYYHVMLKPKTAEVLEELRILEQEEQCYNVTNDVIISQALQLLRKKIKRA